MKELKAYEKACNEVAQAVLKKFKFEQDHDFWIGGEIGGVFYFCDYYLGMDTMVNILKYDFTVDEFFDWYYLSLDLHTEGKDVPSNMKNFIKIYREEVTKGVIGMENINNFFKNHK